jgi:hypothetical protein
MNKFAIMALVGAASSIELTHHHHAKYDGDNFYGDGNAGKHNPKETADAFWHAAHNAESTDDFHAKVANQGAFIPSVNGPDSAPTYHNNGGYVQRQSHHNKLA